MRYKSLPLSIRGTAPPKRRTPPRVAPRRRLVDWVATLVMVLALPLTGIFMTGSGTAASLTSAFQHDVRTTTDGSSASTGPTSATQWAGFSWRGRPPITVVLKSYLSNPGLQGAVSQAAASWSVSDVVDVTVGSTGKRVISLYEADYGAGQPAAWTQVFKRNGSITSVTIYVNDFYLATASEWMMQFAMCHEVGHGLGLDHQLDSVEPGCMSPSMPGTVPNTEDYAQLDLIY